MGFELRFYDFENGKLGYFDTIIVDFSTVISRKIAFDLRCCFSKETPADFPNYPFSKTTLDKMSIHLL